jgi:hypothetical protein
MDELSGNSTDITIVSTEHRRLPEPTTSLVCLNFKVPLQVRQKLKSYATRQNMTMTELLLHLLDDCVRSDAVNAKRSNKEIKKQLFLCHSGLRERHLAAWRPAKVF